MSEFRGSVYKAYEGIFSAELRLASSKESGWPEDEYVVDKVLVVESVQSK